MKKLYDIRWKIDALLILILLPLIGVMAFGKPTIDYLEFPPVTRYVEHASFSWFAFLALAVIILTVVVPVVMRIMSSNRQIANCSGDEYGAGRSKTNYPFPWWGWLGLALTGVTWFMAWTRFSWFNSLQVFTFTPMWLGYILVVNALTYKRTKHCMLRDRPGFLVLLFLISAVFWWYFEYLNRFVQNWYYEGIGTLSRLQYFFFATLPFSTVLPAVLGTRELLESFSRISAGMDDFIKIRSAHPKVLAWLALIVFSLSLAMIGIWPDYLFPLLWVSPLCVITSLQSIRGEKNIFSDIMNGRWKNIYLLALSGLVCGIFWELWNYQSLAKWIYTVPFVNRFRVFEMPILGFAGYLPFGLECAVVADVVTRTREKSEKELGLMELTRPGYATICKYVNGVILACLGVYFFLAPGVIVMRDLSDPNIRGEGIPRIAWRLHKDLTPRYERWARQRIESGKAGHLNLYDVPSTEWPMFGSVYYLWATEALQKAWEKDHSLSIEEPRVYARKTIEAAIDLITDPIHHVWVKTHWGKDYMHTENVFFRSLIIAGCTSYENLVGDGKHAALLRDQIDTLAAELDASPHGVLEDYPGECYPIDILAAIACIQRADKALGADHSNFIYRSVRAFEGDMLDKRGLIPYLMNDDTAEHLGPSRGVGNSYTLIFAPELWLDKAEEWYKLYEKYFWQETWWAAGFREYPRNVDSEFSDYMSFRLFYDVDAGPIVAGFSPAANAFGLAAAKANGRLDHAYTIGTQVLSATWPLPNGSLLGPQILSSRQHAPYLGEACLLFFFTQQPHSSAKIITGGHKPGSVYIGLLFYFGAGLIILLAALRGVRKWKRNIDKILIPYQTFQCSAWVILLFVSLILIGLGYTGTGMLIIVISQFLPQIELKTN